MTWQARDGWRKQRAPALATAAHAVVLTCLLAGFHRGPKIAPYRFPGTAQGVRTLTYFSKCVLIADGDHFVGWERCAPRL